MRRAFSLKLAYSLCALALAGLVPQRAAAQLTGLVTCAATAAAPTVRAEGTMELVGDILLTCAANGGSPAVGRLQSSLSVFLNVDIANAADPTSGVTDAVVLVNENACASPSPTGGTYGSCGAPDPRVQDPQLGVLAAANRLEWNLLDIPYPGAPAGDGSFFPAPTTVRITGIRANAMQLGVPASAGPGAQITAFVSLTGPTTIAVTNNVLNVGIPSSDILNGPSDPSLVSGVSCSTSAIPLPVDPAGATEPLGDLIVLCSQVGAPAPPGSSVTLDIGLLLNTGITNDDLPSPSPPELLVNEGTPLPGLVDREDRVVWRNVTFPIPESPSMTALRIRGVRADVATLMSGGATFPSTQVTGLLLMDLGLSANLLNLGVPFEASSPAPVDGDPGLVTCSVTSVPPLVRAEGIAEIVGDIVVLCTGTSPLGLPITAPFVTMDIFVSLNTEITNNVNFGAGSDVTDAVLVINENNCTAPSSVGATLEGCGAADPRVQDPQFGRLGAKNRLEWRGVRVPVPGAPADGDPVDCFAGLPAVPPGAPASGCLPFTTTLRITSVRANPAGTFGVPSTPTFPSTQITAFLGISAHGFSVTNNVMNVAVPILGRTVGFSEPATGLLCQDGPVELSIDVREGFATAFKTNGTPTFTPGNTQWEAGYFAPGSNLGGGASQGTRLLLRLSGVPEGVRLTLPRVIDNGDPILTGDALRLQWVGGADATGAGGSASFSEGDLVIDPPPGGLATVVYEVMDSNPFLVESAAIPVSVSWDPTGEGGPPAPGAIHAQLSLAPVSTVFEASFPAPEPRFLQAGDPAAILDIRACGPADLAINLGASRDAAQPGRRMAFNVWVANRGPDRAVGVAANVELPEGFELLNARGNCEADGRNLTCAVGLLPARGFSLLRLVGKVANDAAADLTLSGQVSADNDDPVADNNSASLTVPLAR